MKGKRELCGGEALIALQKRGVQIEWPANGALGQIEVNSIGVGDAALVSKNTYSGESGEGSPHHQKSGEKLVTLLTLQRQGHEVSISTANNGRGYLGGREERRPP